ncbi:hypothetical protein [Nocardia sp. NPDC051832]|uniref:hypothetical protein n=1 Tax=Nocardia sp. NPDC051832 TaxID=3155673 RepID=UPI0034329077
MSGAGVAAGADRGYLPTRRAVGVALAILGAIVWSFESLTAWDKSTRPQFQDGTYLRLGEVGLSPQHMLLVAHYAFGFVAVLLVLGAALIAPFYLIGRRLITSACLLVLLGQTVVLILTLLPDDWLLFHPPSSLAASELLMLCPLLTLWCVAGRTRAVPS